MYSSEDLPMTVLHWNYRGFTDFPLRLLEGDEREITDIYLKENLISSLPNDIGRLERLQSLYLSGNDIREVPTEIGKLLHLKCLDLSGNRLVRLPEEIGDVTNLKFLILDDNELVELPLRLSELRSLRYLSVCDNKLRWLPQRPVHNYHLCELKFWRNPDLKALPYSLWYHMFRNQPTRCLNIGCLGTIETQTQLSHRCQLKFQTGEANWKIEIHVPSHYSNVIHADTISPPTLLELCKRALYETLYKTAQTLSNTGFYKSIYADSFKVGKDENGNDSMTALGENFSENLTILDIGKENNNRNLHIKVMPLLNKNKVNNSDRKESRMSHFVPGELVKKYYKYLPQHLRIDLCNGPISRCENSCCKKPVFDFGVFEFCIGKILLIDGNTDEAVLSAVFCSKKCANDWKIGKSDILAWRLVYS